MPRGVVDETPPIRDDYQLALVDGDYFKDKLRPKQFLHIDQSECILCEGCVDICPWKCIHYLSLDAIDEAVNVDHPNEDQTNFGFFIVDEDECTRCALCASIDARPTSSPWASSKAHWPSRPRSLVSTAAHGTTTADRGTSRTATRMGCAGRKVLA